MQLNNGYPLFQRGYGNIFPWHGIPQVDIYIFYIAFVSKMRTFLKSFNHSQKWEVLQIHL